MLLNLLKKWLHRALFLKITLLFLILSLMSAAALAAEKNQVNWISYEKARQEALKTGKPIFIFFHFVNWQNYDRIFYETFSHPTFVAISREFACVDVPVTWAKTGKRKLAGMGHLVRYNPNHKLLYGAFLDPEGRVFDNKYLDRNDPNQFGEYDPNHYTRVLRNILIPYSRWLGQKALKEKKFAIASHRFNVLLKYAQKKQNKELAQAGIAQLERIAAARLQKVNESIKAKKYLEAYEALASIKEDFAGLAPAGEAQKQMAQLDADPLIKNQMERARLERKAKPFYEKAGDYEEQGKHYLAYIAYKSIIESYPNCPSAEKAATRLKEIESDPSLMKLIEAKRARREAKKLFDMAKNLEKNALFDRALIHYQKLLDEFPNSRYAKEAEKKVKELSSY